MTLKPPSNTPPRRSSAHSIHAAAVHTRVPAHVQGSTAYWHAPPAHVKGGAAHTPTALVESCAAPTEPAHVEDWTEHTPPAPVEGGAAHTPPAPVEGGEAHTPPATMELHSTVTRWLAHAAAQAGSGTCWHMFVMQAAGPLLWTVHLAALSADSVQRLQRPSDCPSAAVPARLRAAAGCTFAVQTRHKGYVFCENIGIMSNGEYFLGYCTLIDIKIQCRSSETKIDP